MVQNYLRDYAASEKDRLVNAKPEEVVKMQEKIKALTWLASEEFVRIGTEALTENTNE